LDKVRSGKRLTPEERKALAATAQNSAALAGTGLMHGYDDETSRSELDGLHIWETELRPIFTHPRCLNCHGVVNPETGENHGGGKVPHISVGEFGVRGKDDFRPPCAQCHTASAEWEPAENLFVVSDFFKEWTLPPRALLFVGLSSIDLCARMGAKLHDGERVFFKHFEQDERIKLAFVGLRGMDERSPMWPIGPPAPPPKTHEQFLAALRKWALIGSGSCGWTGTITYTLRWEQTVAEAYGPLHKVSEVRVKLDVKGSHGTETVQFAENTSGWALEAVRCTYNGAEIAEPVGPTELTTSASGTGSGEGTIGVKRNLDGSYSIGFPIFATTGTMRWSQQVHYRGDRPNCKPEQSSGTKDDQEGKSSGSVAGSARCPRSGSLAIRPEPPAGAAEPSGRRPPSGIYKLLDRCCRHGD